MIQPNASQKGFTLIELLVVIVLLGLLTSVMVAGVGGGSQDREFRNEVNKLFAILKLAADEAIFSNEEIGVLIEDGAYEFLVWDEQESKWTASNKQSLRKRVIPEWISVEYRRDSDKKPMLGESQKGEYYANTSTLDIEKNSKVPSFMLLSSGEVDSFVVELQIESDSETRVEIKTNEEGEIVLPAYSVEEDV